MKIHLYSPVHFEKWDWHNSIEKGIGGSETCHIEVAFRLARRNYEVFSYSPKPNQDVDNWRDVHWLDLNDADFTEDGLWIIFRQPSTLDFFNKTPNQQIWLMCQDEDYFGQWNQERADKIDKVLALCKTHAQHLANRHPEIANKIVVTTNGVKTELMREVEKNPPIRNPKRLMYASSPDRGLLNLLHAFKRAREFVEDLELHCYYGIDNIEKLIEYNPKFSHFKPFVAELKKQLDQPGVFWHGRVSQVELYQEWLKTGIWCYPTSFSETSCITCLESQCLGAIPLTNPYWALAENVKYGIFIQGNPDSDELVKARYSSDIVRLATQPEWQEQIRKEMMPAVRTQFCWERVIDAWEAWILGMTDKFFVAQYAFHFKHATGKVLNIGCGHDLADIKSLGAVNLDIALADPIHGNPNKVDILADARDLPESLHNSFDSIILGDILEHMSEEDIVKSLKCAKKCLREDGYLIITIPDDDRDFSRQHIKDGVTGKELYADGISCFHLRRISKEDLERMISGAGMSIKFIQELDYAFFPGFGILCS